MNYLVRKPDAGKPHVRFDERGVETESTASYSGTSNRKGWSPLRLRLNFTAPLLESAIHRAHRMEIALKTNILQTPNRPSLPSRLLPDALS